MARRRRHGYVCGGGDLRRSFNGREIWPSAFPCGDLASFHSAIPTPLPRGPLRNNGKSARGPQRGPLVFFAPFPRLQKQAFDARYGHKKSPQALLESFFPLLAVRGGL